MTKPMASVIIPCYQHAHLVPHAICSALRQISVEVEVIIVDDGSTDDLSNVVEQYGYMNRVIYSRQEHKGLAAARNIGMDLARGQFIQFLDADDIIYSEKIQKQIYAMQRDALDVTHSDFCCVHGLTGQPSKKYASPSTSPNSYTEDVVLKWEIGLSIPCHCFLYRSATIANLRFDTTLPNHEDWLFHCAVAASGVRSVYIPEVLCEYRIFPESMARDKAAMTAGYDALLERISHLPPPFRELAARRRRIDRGELV